MKHIIFAKYLHSDESFDIQSTLVDHDFDYEQPLVKWQKFLLKKHGYQQKGHCCIVVDDAALVFLKLKLSNIKHVEFVTA